MSAALPSSPTVATEIAVLAAPPAAKRVLVALERAWPVRFVFASMPAGAEDRLELNHRGGFVFRQSATPVITPEPKEKLSVSFARRSLLDVSVRGLADLDHKPLPLPPAVPLAPGDEPLATLAGVPVWAARRDPTGETHTVSAPVPELGATESTFDHLHGDKFITLLPLVHFVKQALLRDGWRFPALRAGLMFDDPNLHWPTYGFVSYAEIARRSRAANYHVSFATVPLDGWFAQGKAAALFRENADRLSLLMHGNDHLYAELARPRDAAGHRALIAQGLRRIAAMEKRSGVAVCRTMAPPHGACSNGLMAAMLELGVEAAYSSPWSLRLWEEGRTWPAELGLTPAEIVGRGFAVLPRFKLSNSCHGWVMLAALLGRPMVPVGHHHDMRDAPDLLDEAAAIINRLPAVAWVDTGCMARGNYFSRLSADGRTCEVLPHASRFEVKLPTGVTTLRLLPPAVERDQPVAFPWQMRAPDGTWRAVDREINLPAGHTGPMQLKLAALGEIDPNAVPSPGVKPAAVARRILCEVRDRAQPLVARIKRGGRGQRQAARQ